MKNKNRPIALWILGIGGILLALNLMAGEYDNSADWEQPIRMTTMFVYFCIMAFSAGLIIYAIKKRKNLSSATELNNLEEQNRILRLKIEQRKLEQELEN